MVWSLKTRPWRNVCMHGNWYDLAGYILRSQRAAFENDWSLSRALTEDTFLVKVAPQVCFFYTPLI